jgi:ABC-type uncharacterized transport system involved in gliding motility auxiliary subunit
MKNEPTSARATRRSAGLQSATNLALVVFILLMVNYLGFKYYSHVDLSSSQFYTLSPKTQEVLKKLDSPLRITTILINKERAQYWDQTQNLLKEYQRVGGKNVTVEKVDPVYDRARAVALQNELHFTGTDNLVIFQYKNGNRFVKQDDLVDLNPMTQEVSGYKGEQQFTSAIVSLEEGKPSKVYFTAGHGEHAINDNATAAGYGLVNQALKGENLDIAELNLAARSDVPADAQAVVIAGPSVPFSATEAQALDKYLANNGKLLVLLDPYAPLGLDDVLKKYGLGFDNDMVLYRGLTSAGSQTTVPLALIYQGGFAQHPITAKFPDAGYYLQIVDARSINLQVNASSPAPKTQWLLQTGPDSWGWVMKGNPTSADFAGITNRTFDKAAGDIPGPLTISALYDGGTVTDPATKTPMNATRLVLIGSAHFLENDSAESVGTNFFINALDWLVKKNAVLSIEPKRPQEYGVNLSPMSERTVVWTALLFVPGLALALGIFTWFSRRK